MNILVLSGDGIGPEVTAEAVRILKRVGTRHAIPFQFEEGVVGGKAIDRKGHPLPAPVLKKAMRADAILLGAVGGPKWDTLPHAMRPEQALLGLRSGLKLFANLRPARIFDPLVDASTLKREVVQGIDLLVVRELTGGIYFGKPRGIRGKGKVGVNTEIYTEEEITRIGRVAFEAARKRRRKVTSVDKANILESSILWRQTITAVAKEYPDVSLEHMYVDNCAMQLVRNPRQFDVIVTSNLFGDILSDEAAMLTGSIGMLPSASLGEGKNRLDLPRGMYEPVHGSAPDIAGKGLANPLATILSSALLLRYSLGLEEPTMAIEEAVNKVLEKGYRTADIGGEGTRRVTTQEMGEAVQGEL